MSSSKNGIVIILIVRNVHIVQLKVYYWVEIVAKMLVKTLYKFVLILSSFGFAVSNNLSSEDSFKNWRNLDRLKIGGNVSNSSSSNNNSSRPAVLSRKRRFIYPAVSPWYFDIRDLFTYIFLRMFLSFYYILNYWHTCAENRYEQFYI